MQCICVSYPPQTKKVFSLRPLRMRVIVYASRGSMEIIRRRPDGAFQKKRSLGKMGLLKRMGLRILTLDSSNTPNRCPRVRVRAR